MNYRSRLPRVLPGAVLLAMWAPHQVAALDIVINPGSVLQSNSAALAAFNRAAAQWESRFSDPITVTIDANLVSLANPNVIGQAGSVLLQDSLNNSVFMMQLDAADEPSNGVVAFLPDQSQFSALLPSGFSLATVGQDALLVFTKANAKALNYDLFYGPGYLDTTFGTTDATIEFNSNFSFDYDNSNGVTPGTMDFETVAAHEIGHALGFISSVDDVDFYLSTGERPPIAPTTLDMFRFESGTANDPSNTSEFTIFPRNLVPGGNQAFDDLTIQASLATGTDHGDGNQASHWKDNMALGIMDPTLSFGETGQISPNDQRALSDIGWDDVVPEPSTYAAGAFVLFAAAGAWRRTRRS